MNRLLFVALLLAALTLAGCGPEGKNANKDKDKPEPPPAAKQ